MRDQNDIRPMSASETSRSITTALIIAAGMGSRLENNNGLPKPLTPLIGVPMIQRIMAVSAKAGIRRFVVVVGFEAERMKEALPVLLPEGCELTVVENPRFMESNGVSLLAGARTLSEPFVLLMSDHIFSHDRIADAMAHFRKTARSLLVVEDRSTFDGDIADATRVAVEDGKIRNIGKHLQTYDGIDTGMFVLQPEPVIRALEQPGSSPSISEGMAVLASSSQLDALFLDTGFWQDIDTPEDVRTAERKLLRSLVKPEDGFLARHVNRRISLFLTRRLSRIGIHPNWMTLATLVFGISAGFAFAQGSGVLWGLLGATLLQVQSILDGVDGELARLLHRETRFGFWLDVSVDNISHMAVFGGIAAGQHVDGLPGPWPVLGILSVLGVAACFFTMAPLLKGTHPPDGTGGLLKRLVEGLSRRDFTYLLFPLAALQWLGGFLWVAAVGTWSYAAAVVYLRIQARQPASSTSS